MQHMMYGSHIHVWAVCSVCAAVSSVYMFCLTPSADMPRQCSAAVGCQAAMTCENGANVPAGVLA